VESPSGLPDSALSLRRVHVEGGVGGEGGAIAPVSPLIFVA